MCVYLLYTFIYIYYNNIKYCYINMYNVIYYIYSGLELYKNIEECDWLYI